MTVIIREATTADAAALLAYMKEIFAEPGINLITMPDEFNLTEEAEARYIADLTRGHNSLYLVAEHDGEIIGQLTLHGEKRRNIRHMTTLGITVAKAWRGQGIGRRLIEDAIEFARQSGVIRRIELHVFARNTAAIHLYEACGFEIEGRRRRAVYRDGDYVDDVVMAVLI